MGYATRSKSSAAAPAPAALPAKRRAAAAPAPKPKKAPAARTATPTPGQTSPALFPDIPVQTDAGGDPVPASTLFADRGAVVFLYPRANTPGCTSQACGLRDAADALAAAGFGVFGLSYDAPPSQARWRTKHALPFPLLCDTPARGLIAALGAARPGNKIRRSHFIVEKGGRILDAQIQVSPAESVRAATAFVAARARDPAEEDAEKDDRKDAEMEPKDDATTTEGTTAADLEAKPVDAAESGNAKSGEVAKHDKDTEPEKDDNRNEAAKSDKDAETDDVAKSGKDIKPDKDAEPEKAKPLLPAAATLDTTDPPAADAKE